MRSSNRSGLELALAAIALALLAAALWGSPIAQSPHYHAFADARELWHIPFAADVLSNAGFALAGLVGAVTLRRVPPRAVSNMQRAMAMLFFVGLLLTAAGSAWYHAHPDDTGLALDRTAMAVACAGLLGYAVAVHVSERSAAAAGLVLLLLGALAVHSWTATGNLRPWVVLQAGGMAVLAWLAMVRPRAGAPQVRWSLVIVAYAMAKLFELGDHALHALSGGAFAGHTLKHLAAAASAAPVISGLAALGRRPGQNRRQASARQRNHPWPGSGHSERIM